MDKSSKTNVKGRIATGKVSVSGGSVESSVQTTNINKLLSIVGFLVLGFCVFAMGFFSGKYWGGSDGTNMPGSSWGGSDGVSLYDIIGKKENQEVTDINFDLFWDVWSTLNNQYVDKDVSQEDLYYGAIKGLVSGVDDPVTIFLTPEETEEYNKGNAGKFEGIGIEMGYENGNLAVVAPLEGSPAQKAGLKSGDIILEVDGEDIGGKNIYKIVSMIRGDSGTDVTLTIIHKGEDKKTDITITRGEITVPSVTFEEMKGDIAIIDLDRFTESSYTAWQNRWNKVISEVEDEDPDAIVLDLRGNPGGYFNAAVWAAGEFLDDGKLVAKQRDRNGNETDFKVARKGKFLNTPLVVLVDNGSASASEILAGALQHYKRAYIIGEETYGKGTAQDIITYDNGSSLHITTLNWVLPDGKVLSKDRVIKPNKNVQLTDEDFKEGNDPQMDEALKYLNSY